MPLTIEEVEYFAELARLDLRPEEKEYIRLQLSAILEHFHQLQDIDTSRVAPTTSGVSSESRLREDVPLPGLTLDELLLNAPQVDQDQFRIPPVFE